jgi:hypothetical protein
MSIACLGLLPSVNVQGLNVESPNPSANAGYSAINQSNNLIAGVNVPNAVWTSSVAVSNDPDIPNSLAFTVVTNSPVAPEAIALVLSPSGGSNEGSSNGTIVEVGGDLIVAGVIVNNNSNSGKTGGEVEAFEGFFNDYVDNSYYIQDDTNKVITIWINISGKVANTQTNSANTGIIAIPNNPNDNVYIPPVSADYVDDQGGVNFINFMMNIQSNGGNTTTGGLAYLSQGSNTGIIYFSPSYTWTADDALVIQGTLSYPY